MWWDKGVLIVQSQDPPERRHLGQPSGPSASKEGARRRRPGTPAWEDVHWFFIFLFPMRSLRKWKKKKRYEKENYIYIRKPRVSWRGFYNQCQEILCLCASNSERLLCLVIGKGPMDSVGQYSAEATFQVGLELSFLFVSLAPNFSPPLLTPLFLLPLILILILILLAAFTAVWDSLMKVRPIKENSTAHRVCMLFFRVRLFI